MTPLLSCHHFKFVCWFTGHPNTRHQRSNFKSSRWYRSHKNLCSDNYVREKTLSTHSLKNFLRIRLANGSVSMARYGVYIEFHIGTLKITPEFIVTMFSSQQKSYWDINFSRSITLTLIKHLAHYAFPTWKQFKPIWQNAPPMINIYPVNKCHVY